MILAVATLALLLVQTSCGAVQTSCTSKSQCASHECCYDSNLLTIVRKRQMLPFNLGKGTCRTLAKVGQRCDYMRACGCETGSICRPDNLNYLLGSVNVKRRMSGIITAHCQRDMSV